MGQLNIIKKKDIEMMKNQSFMLNILKVLPQKIIKR
jgi:hypothetical protein